MGRKDVDRRREELAFSKKRGYHILIGIFAVSWGSRTLSPKRVGRCIYRGEDPLKL